MPWGGCSQPIRGPSSPGRKTKLSIPPSVTFQQDPPRKANDSSPPPKRRAVAVVKSPNEKATDEHESPASDHGPHDGKNFGVSAVFGSGGGILFCPHRVFHSTSSLAPCFVHLQRGPQGIFHDINATCHDNHGQDRICALMERRIL